MTGDVKALAQVKTVRGKPVNPGIEMQFGALQTSRLPDQPLEHLLAPPAGLLPGLGPEIVHIEKSSPHQALENAVSGDRHGWLARRGEEHQMVTGCLLAPNPPNKFGFTNVRSQFGQGGETAPEIGFGSGVTDGEACFHYGRR